LVKDRLDAFSDVAERLATDTRPLPARLSEVVALDPAARILELKICDPATGSGHFLVSLIDYLAAQVFTATGEAAAKFAWATYQSPVLQRLATIRDRIGSEAAANGWTVRAEQLTDANLVKRMFCFDSSRRRGTHTAPFDRDDRLFEPDECLCLRKPKRFEPEAPEVWRMSYDALLAAMASPSNGTLLPCPDESVDWNTTQNLMIEGEVGG
jgi:hypothetical protein